MSNDSFLAISDIHLGSKLFNLPELAQDLKDNLIQAFDLALALKVKYVFVVGDLYDTNKPSPDLIKFVSDQVKRLGANGCLVAGIAGDHDKPINNSAWVHLSNMLPINSVPPVGKYVGFDYTDNSMENVAKIAALPNKDKIEWIFLHGQVPELFQFTEDKKKLDLKELDLVNNFPRLRGVILGDIHTPIESVIYDPAQKREDTQYIGYCGSLGMVRTDEIIKKGILYYDGTKLERVPFKLDREFIRINIEDLLAPINLVPKFSKFFRENNKKKPIFFIEYDRDSKEKLPEIAPLYEVGIVKTSQVRRGAKNSEVKETINIRSSLKANEKIAQTLKELTAEQDVYDLSFALLTSDDPKAILDKYKKSLLE